MKLIILCIFVFTVSAFAQNITISAKAQKFLTKKLDSSAIIFKVQNVPYDNEFSLKLMEAVDFQSKNESRLTKHIHFEGTGRSHIDFNSSTSTYSYIKHDVGCLNLKDTNDIAPVEKYARSFLKKVLGNEESLYILARTDTSWGSECQSGPKYLQFNYAKVLNGRIMTDNTDLSVIEIGEKGAIHSFSIPRPKLLEYRVAKRSDIISPEAKAKEAIESLDITSQALDGHVLKVISKRAVSGRETYIRVSEGNQDYLVPHISFLVERSLESGELRYHSVFISEDDFLDIDKK